MKDFRPTPHQDDECRIRVSSEPRKSGSQAVIVSHNWCDPCTWYTESERLDGYALSDSGNSLRFCSGIANWIDLSHGRLHREDLVAAAYLPKVYVDGYEKTERAAWSDSGGDFEIDYESGQVVFFESQAGKTVTADFSYENGSMCLIAPSAGKKLWVEKSEVQFSDDVELRDTTHFQPWAYNPYDPPNKVPVKVPTSYKNVRDFVDEANGTYPQIPAFGGATRGLACAHFVFPFNYLSVKELCSSLGLEIRVWLEGDTPFGGTFATATFYCTSFDEE